MMTYVLFNEYNNILIHMLPFKMNRRIYKKKYRKIFNFKIFLDLTLKKVVKLNSDTSIIEFI